MPTGRNSAYEATARKKPPVITRALPKRVTSLGVSVGARTASMPVTTRATAVCRDDQPRSSCR